MGFNPGGGGGISSANDVALSNPSESQVLTYDASLAKWKNAASTGGGGGTNLGSRTIIVAANDETSGVKAVANFVCDGVSDQVQINAALASVGVENLSKGTNGGLVLLVGRNFNVDGPILVPSQTTIAGAYGKQGTWITRSGSYAPGEGGGLIQCATDNTQYIEIRDLGLNGMNASVCGVYLYTAAGQEYDAFHVVKNLFIWNVGQHGLRVQNGASGRLRGNHFSEIRIINAGVYGVYSQCPDSFYERIDSGSSGSHGFYCGHANNRYVNCKAWFSDGAGFYVAGGRDNQFTGCESQDNMTHGYHINSTRNSFAACCADSNGYTGTGDGFFIAGRGTNVQGTATEKSEHTASQRYGVNISGAPVGIIVNVTTAGNTSGSVNGSAGAGSYVNVADSPF